MKKLFSNVLTIAVLAGVGTAVGFAIAFTRPVEAQIIEKEKTVTVIEQSPDEIAPVMERIMDCESGTRLQNGKAVPGTRTQFKNGQVLISLNTNGTYDQGIAQINSIHNKDASNRGYNLATEEGSEGYARYMYYNLGTGDWASSQACWKR